MYYNSLKLFIYLFFIIFTLNVFIIGFLPLNKSLVYEVNNNKIKKNIYSNAHEKSIQELKRQIEIIPSPSPINTTFASTKDYIYFPVSKTNSLNNFIPDDLIVLNTKYSTRKVQVSRLIENDLLKLIESARKDGIELKVVSGYRSYFDQESTFNSYVQNELKSAPGITLEEAIKRTSKYSAKPGHSEHQLGTTVDLLSNETNYQFSSDTNNIFAKWLEINAIKFNFRISYPYGNPEYIYEPWHLRWRV